MDTVVGGELAPHEREHGQERPLRLRLPRFEIAVQYDDRYRVLSPVNHAVVGGQMNTSLR